MPALSDGYLLFAALDPPCQLSWHAAPWQPLPLARCKAPVRADPECSKIQRRMTEPAGLKLYPGWDLHRAGCHLGQPRRADKRLECGLFVFPEIEAGNHVADKVTPERPTGKDRAGGRGQGLLANSTGGDLRGTSSIVYAGSALAPACPANGAYQLSQSTERVNRIGLQPGRYCS